MADSTTPIILDSNNATITTNWNSNDIEKLKDRITVLENEWDDLNKRQCWQEQIHRNVLGNGNVTHYYNIIPSLLIAGATSFFITSVIINILKTLKKN